MICNVRTSNYIFPANLHWASMVGYDPLLPINSLQEVIQVVEKNQSRLSSSIELKMVNNNNDELYKHSFVNNVENS